MLYSTLASAELMTWRALKEYGCDADAVFVKAGLDRRHLSMRVKVLLIDRLASGQANQGSIADALHVGIRTLQRRLADEGTSYKRLLDATRRELAEQYVKQSHLSINEIGFLVGFSEPANFSRAFRRWTGSTPSVARAAVT